MPSTYDPTTIRTIEKDWVRFNIGDRGSTFGSRAFILDDDEILAAIAQERNKWMAAFRCGMVILSKGFGISQKSVDGLMIQWGDTNQVYRKHLEALRAQGTLEQLSTNRLFTVLSID